VQRRRTTAQLVSALAVQRAAAAVDPSSVLVTRSVAPALLGLRHGRTLPLAGELPPWPRLAVVGSRAAHAGPRAAVPPAIEVVAALGWSIVSGGAIGIDRDAHAAALARGVPQLAVLPCGPDLLYPADNAPLLRAIAARARSGVLFAVARGGIPSRNVFASRNAIVVALCDAVLVVESQPRSGSALTGQLALRGRKPLAVVAGSPGNAALVGRGARPLRFEADAVDRFAAELRAFLRGEAPPSAPRPWPHELAHLRDLLAAAGRQGLRADGLDPAGLVALVRAEALGLVLELSPGRWILA
jgi:DNA processing protein